MMTDAEILTVEYLMKKIEDAKTEKEKSEYANVWKNAVCKHSKIQEYYCGVIVPFPSHFCCDFCLEDELFQLWRCGVHTTGSCCGHGIMQPYIQVLDGESVQKMHELGYEKLPVDEHGNGVNCYKPKTYLPEYTEG